MTHKTADKILDGAAETYRERNKVYGSNYLNFGPTMVGLFPDGVTLKTEEDFIRFHLLLLDVVKTTRYCQNFDKGGHQDSIHDKVVYCAMLEAYDEDVRGKRVLKFEGNAPEVFKMPPDSSVDLSSFLNEEQIKAMDDRIRSEMSKKIALEEIKPIDPSAVPEWAKKGDI